MKVMKMNKLIPLYQKNKSVILYLLFGGLTTVVNIVTYHICYEILFISNLLSTILAWLFSVIFAYFTNRIFVFESKAKGIQSWVQEIFSFFACRIATGVMDVVIMVVAVDYFHQNSMLWKVISNILVIVINYIASKYLIFKKS